MSELERLQQITRTLREPGGCEWDREQDYRSMRRYVLEEVHELVHAINTGDIENLVEELGDLLFHVFFFARMGEEEGRFNLEDVARGIADKLVRRHPHVFGEVQVDGVGQILENWEAIKAAEKSQPNAGESAEPVSAIPAKTGRELTALMRAEKIQKKASKVGFDWRDVRGVLEKLHEEIQELSAELAGTNDNAPDPERLEDELGDVLFCAVNLARHLKVEPETALSQSNDKFLRRFHCMERIAAEAGQDFAQLSEEQLDQLWNQAKARLHAHSNATAGE